jgi:L-methionine (R)-S-oxide reductase
VSVLDAIAAVIERESDPDAIVSATVTLLHDGHDRYSWIGVYYVEGSELVLGPWHGPAPTEHTRIPVGRGICGAAAATGRTEIVGDVNADERYIACFVSTRAEIVVPVINDGRVVAEIDIDSDTPAAFGESDRELLERVAALIGPYCARPQ